MKTFPAPNCISKAFTALNWIVAIALVMGLGAAQAEADADRISQKELNYGYARLYGAAGTLRLLDELLLVKLESKETEQVIGQIAAYGSRLRSELEDLERAHPAVSLDDEGRSRLQQDVSKRQQRDRMRALAPLTGASGADFERTLLLTQSGALNQLRFLADAIAHAETNESRRAYVKGVRRELDRLYVQTVELLDRRYFKPPAKTPLGAAGKNEDDARE
jgi:hypothetical protein